MSQNVNSIIKQNIQHKNRYVRTKISVDFHICVSVPLKEAFRIVYTKFEYSSQ